MSHVEIKPSGKGHTVAIDGVDVTDYVAAKGFKIVWEEHGPVVHLQLKPLTTLTANLPDALLKLGQDSQ